MEAGLSRHDNTRVWVVEDDADQLVLMERRLRGSGWSVRGFAEGEAMEQALQDDLPHVLILDRLLPRQSGTHLLQRLRQKGYRFPVLMLSALGSADERITGLETCLLYTSPSPRDRQKSRMPSSA